jgi:N-formylglutamate deformylase
MTLAPYLFRAGSVPLLMSIPHVGEAIPGDIRARMTAAGREIADTDWHLDRLYDFADALGISVIQATQSRYVIDLNRAPDGVPLYPGASNTELVPLTSFANEPLYRDGLAPDESEVARRREIYWHPYHARLDTELAAMRDRFGVAVLFDCHSIRSHVPRFFEGRLPDFNLGTAAGTSCDTALRSQLGTALAAESRYTLAIDGRFKGGYITRRYGRPADRVHGFQLELSLVTYMAEEPAYRWREDLAEQVRPSLRRMVETAIAWADEKRR